MAVKTTKTAKTSKTTDKIPKPGQISAKRKLAARKTDKPTKPDTSVLLDLRLNHRLTYEEIGRITGRKKQAIHNQIKHLIPTAHTQDYISNRAEILAHQQLRLLSTGLTDAKLKKTSARDAVVSMGILYDKERLERGQATSITDVRSLILELDAAEARALSMIPSHPTLESQPQHVVVDVTPRT